MAASTFSSHGGEDRGSGGRDTAAAAQSVGGELRAAGSQPGEDAHAVPATDEHLVGGVQP